MSPARLGDEPTATATATATAAATAALGALDAVRLVVLDGEDRGAELRVSSGEHRIGKASDCALRLRDRAVSRHHLEVSLRPDGLCVRDLSSKNGSFYQGARFSEVVLPVGAVVRIGDTALKLLASEHKPVVWPASEHRFGGLLGRSLKMRELFTLLKRVAASDATVLVDGETGTGKEVCAAALHAESARARASFVICDLAGIPGSLLESELFGHVRGAFTGAVANKSGLFTDATGGTLFIDEIGELPLELQPRLLRAIESRQVRPVGGQGYHAVDVRIIAATNRDLLAESKARRFRVDLFHRLAVVRVTLPPLRERKEDIALLVEHFVAARGVTVPPESLAVLGAYDWPGNVRELKNVVDRALALLGGERVLRPELLELTAADQVARGGDDFFALKERVIASWERGHLESLLQRAGGSVAGAARLGGIERAYFHRLMKKHRLRR